MGRPKKNQTPDQTQFQNQIQTQTQSTQPTSAEQMIDKKYQQLTQEYTGVAVDFSSVAQSMLEVNRYGYSAKAPDTQMRPRKYSRSDIRRFLENPQSYDRQLREVSQYLMASSSHYRRLISYFSTMLTLDWIVSPIMRNGEPLSETAGNVFRRNYERSLRYMENFNVKHEIGKIIDVLMTEGVFYGYEIAIENSFMIQRFPANNCRIIGQEDGTFIYAFNMASITNEADLVFYPEDFKEMYAKFKADRTNSWQPVDGVKGVCFKFDQNTLNYSIPPFTGIFEEIMDLEDYKDLRKIKTKIDNYKILLQKIPMKKDPKNEKDFVLTLPTITTYHNAIKGVLPEGVNVVSTPMDLTDISFENTEKEQDKVGQAEDNLFHAAGTATALFSGGTNSGELNRSIEMDSAFMFPILRQTERFFRKRLNNINTGNQQFKIIMPDLTIYNRGDMFDKYIKAAEYGFPKGFCAAALGCQVADLLALSVFEDTFLDIVSHMKPLQSAHTSSGDAGAPKKDVNKLSDEGMRTADSNKNSN